jgi:hypothetical protein
MFTIPDGLPPELYPLSYLLGTWEGEGTLAYPGIEDAATRQRVVFTHNEGIYLEYQASTDLLDADGNVTQRWHDESGFWRLSPHEGQNDPPFALEVFVADAAGIVTIYLGEVSGPRIDLASDVMARAASSARVDAATRMYGLVDGDLLWAWDLAAFGESLRSYMAARLSRVEQGANS